MNRLVKTWLTWMLLLVLPAQALASVVNVSCGPDHHAASASGARSAPHAHHDTDHSHHHHAANARAAHDEAAAGQSHASDKFTHSTCSACAACCVGAAVMPSLAAWAPFHTASFIHRLAPPASFTGHIPSGLERPPRHTAS